MWASPDQSPERQTVPTRGPTITPTSRATNTAVPPTDTPPSPGATLVPTTDTPPPPGATRVPTTATPVPQVQTPTNSPSPVEQVIAIAREGLRVRSAPSTSATVVGQLKKGDSARVVGRTVANDWWQILVPSNPNLRGWISAAFTDTSGTITSIPIVKAGDTPVPLETATVVPAIAQISRAVATSQPEPTDPPEEEPAIADDNQTGMGRIIVAAVAGIVLLGIGGGIILAAIGGVLILRGRRKSSR